MLKKIKCLCFDIVTNINRFPSQASPVRCLKLCTHITRQVAAFTSPAPALVWSFPCMKKMSELWGEGVVKHHAAARLV